MEPKEAISFLKADHLKPLIISGNLEADVTYFVPVVIIFLGVHN